MIYYTVVKVPFTSHFCLVYFLHNLLYTIMWYILKMFTEKWERACFHPSKIDWEIDCESWGTEIVANTKEDKDYEDKHLFYLEYFPLINCLQ